MLRNAVAAPCRQRAPWLSEGGRYPRPIGAAAVGGFALTLQTQFKVSAVGLQRLRMPSVPGRVCARSYGLYSGCEMGFWAGCFSHSAFLGVVSGSHVFGAEHRVAEPSAAPVGGRGRGAPSSVLLLC